MVASSRVGDCDWQFPISVFIFSFIEISVRSRPVPPVRDYICSYERKSICRPPLAFPERCSSRGDLCFVKQSHFQVVRRCYRHSYWQVFARSVFPVGNSQRGPEYNRRRLPPFSSRKTWSGWHSNTIDSANRVRIE